MKNIFYYETKIGTLGIEENGSAVTRIFTLKDIKDKNSENLNETPLLKEAIKQINEYLDGARKDFDIPLSLEGTEFQIKVWNELKKIPYGETRSYKEIAVGIGNEKACRAVGMANNKNPIMIVVPCHRVIGANGKLVGYEGGLDLKEKLLNIEKKS